MLCLLIHPCVCLSLHVCLSPHISLLLHSLLPIPHICLSLQLLLHLPPTPPTPHIPYHRPPSYPFPFACQGISVCYLLIALCYRSPLICLSHLNYPISIYSHQGISVSYRFVTLHLRIPHISSHFPITSIHLLPSGYICLQSFCHHQWYHNHCYSKHPYWYYLSTSIRLGGRLSSSLYPSCRQFCGCRDHSHYQSHCYPRASIINRS